MLYRYDAKRYKSIPSYVLALRDAILGRAMPNDATHSRSSLGHTVAADAGALPSQIKSTLGVVNDHRNHTALLSTMRHVKGQCGTVDLHAPFVISSCSFPAR
jgi:hypothetical protein